MRAPVYVFDPTIADSQSKVRGIGRYLQILRENCPPDWIFTGNLSGIPTHAILIQPFYSFHQSPLITHRITDRQIAVIHDIIPLKYSVHFPIGIKAHFYMLLQKHNLGLFDLILTDSQVSKGDIVSYLKIKEDKVAVLYPTLAKCFWDWPKKQAAPRNHCLYVGDGTWNKNLPLIARAIKKADVTCMFVGKIFADTNPDSYTHPWQKDLHTFFSETNGDSRFIFKGYISDEELLQLYEQSKLNILLSRDEGFGFSYVEAASRGCPSLLSDIPIFHEIAGENARFIDQNNPDAVANTITELLNNPAKLEELSFGALEQSKRYNVAYFRKRLLEIVYPY